MPDQANRLRMLVHDGFHARSQAADAPPLLLTVVGGKGGVGATTVAVNLSVALARDGRRTVLVDADLGKADAAALCRIADGYTVADVLSGRRSVHEALVRGPAGTQVLPGAWATGHVTDCAPEAQQRLLAELARLGPHADFIVLDVGSRMTQVVRQFWQASDRVLLVTSPEAASIMNAYAAVKLQAGAVSAPRVHVVVNLALDANAAADAQCRLALACRRFLGLEPHDAGFLSLDPQVAAAGRARTPFVLDYPGSTVTAQLERLAASLAVSVPENPTDFQNRVNPQAAGSR